MLEGIFSNPLSFFRIFLGYTDTENSQRELHAIKGITKENTCSISEKYKPNLSESS